MVRPDLGTKQYSFINVRASQAVLMVKNPPANAGDTIDTGSIPGSGRVPGGGNGNLLQYSCLENSMYRGAWQDKCPCGHKVGHNIGTKYQQQHLVEYFKTNAC